MLYCSCCMDVVIKHVCPRCSRVQVSVIPNSGRVSCFYVSKGSLANSTSHTWVGGPTTPVVLPLTGEAFTYYVGVNPGTVYSNTYTISVSNATLPVPITDGVGITDHFSYPSARQYLLTTWVPTSTKSLVLIDTTSSQGGATFLITMGLVRLSARRATSPLPPWVPLLPHLSMQTATSTWPNIAGPADSNFYTYGHGSVIINAGMTAFAASGCVVGQPCPVGINVINSYSVYHFTLNVTTYDGGSCCPAPSCMLSCSSLHYVPG